MKHLLFVLLTGSLAGVSCNDQRKPAVSSEAASQAQTANASGNFYKRYEGTIAGKQVVMHLHKAGNSYDGIYYYRDIGIWLTLNADSVSGDSLFLAESVTGDNWSTEDVKSAHLRCRQDKEYLKGTWFSGDGKRSYLAELQESYPAGSGQFSFEHYSDSSEAFPGRKETPAARINYSFVVPAGNDWLSLEIKRILGFDSLQGFREGFAKVSRDYFAHYRSELPQGDDTSGMPLATYNYDQSENILVRFNDNDFIVLESAYYEYSGGAHGNYGSRFYCFDLTGKRLLKLSDILNADSATLQPIAEKYFRSQYHVGTAPLSDVLFEDHLPVNDNFYFNEQGIGFLYNPYEVASYAQGQINVFIPFKAVDKLLVPAFKNRLRPD